MCMHTQMHMCTYNDMLLVFCILSDQGSLGEKFFVLVNGSSELDRDRFPGGRRGDHLKGM